MQKDKKREPRILEISVDFTNIKRRVKSLEMAYDYLSDLSGHFAYEIRDFNHPAIIIERGEL